ncbi:MAG: PEP-CTERM sorting domain-containing protein [Proteobacteria bacterium]|nr:PEP-CTERM sorting domain-containing protein [Pseudomonadota bacterium]
MKRLAARAHAKQATAAEQVNLEAGQTPDPAATPAKPATEKTSTGPTRQKTKRGALANAISRQTGGSQVDKTGGSHVDKTGGTRVDKTGAGKSAHSDGDGESGKPGGGSQAELTEWEANFGSPLVATVNSVPEPATLALLAAGAGAFAFLSRRRSS